MKCPGCGKEMEAGYAFGKIPWLPESAKRPLIWNRDSVEKAGGVMLTNPLVRSSDGAVQTKLCKKCKIGLFHYEE